MLYDTLSNKKNCGKERYCIADSYVRVTSKKMNETILNLTQCLNPHRVASADSSKPSLDPIPAAGCVEIGDRQAACASVMGQHGVCKGGCSSVHRRSRYKSLIYKSGNKGASLLVNHS